MCMSMKNGRGTMKPSSGGASGKDTMGKWEHSDDRLDSFSSLAKSPSSQHCKPRGESPTRHERVSRLVRTTMPTEDGKSMQDTGKSHDIGKQALVPIEASLLVRYNHLGLT